MSKQSKPLTIGQTSQVYNQLREYANSEKNGTMSKKAFLERTIPSITPVQLKRVILAAINDKIPVRFAGETHSPVNVLFSKLEALELRIADLEKFIRSL